MPGWRQFGEAHADDGFEIVSIALDHEGPEAARPYAETAGPDITTLVDDKGLLSAHYQFLVVPNGYLVDEHGVLQFAQHGFSVDDPADVAAVERFIATGSVDRSSLTEAPYELSQADLVSIEVLLRESRVQREAGDAAAAADSMRKALRLDPKNFTIRKQIWALEHPDRFYPEIDFDWQEVQLKRETEQETADGWYETT